MQKTIVGLIAVFGIALASTATASPVVRVTALASTVWLQQGDEKRRLAPNDELSIGDNIVTGDNGKVEIQLWSDLVLRIYPGTEIRIQPDVKSEDASPDNPSELYLHLGKICVKTGPPSSSGRNFVLKVVDRMIAAIHQSAHICVSHDGSSSSVRLRQGSVQLTNSIDSSIVVLSQAGIEFSLNDDGSYHILPPTDLDTIADIDPEPFITETTEADVADSDATETSEPAADSDNNAGAYIYTVYLFSTRSEEVANQVNEKFQQAGYDTRILVNEKDSAARYRLAVSGFESRQSAEEFAAAIVGKLGIADTWIGKDRPGDAD